MKTPQNILFLLSGALLFLSCSGSQFDEYEPVNTPRPRPEPENVDWWDAHLELKDLGYSTSSNATILVKTVDLYVGDTGTAYLPDAFLGNGMPEITVVTRDSVRVFINPTRDAHIFAQLSDNNFSILGYNGVEVRDLTYNHEVLGDKYVTYLKMSYDITNDIMVIEGLFSPFTKCGFVEGRKATLYFEGAFSADINGYEGNFEWKEGNSTEEGCPIRCSGTMAVVFDELAG